MTAALFVVAVIVTSVLFALLEVQIEGREGWARSLPTWRIENRWTRILYAGRALTGYHLYSQLFILVMLHVPFLIGLAGFTWPAEMRVLAFQIFFWIFEDFFWFVINPAYGLRGFRKERIPWHAPTWWWIMPRDYWLFFPVGVMLYLLSVRYGG